MRLRDIMTAGVVTIGPRESVAAARARMRGHGIRHLVVVDDDRVVGIISERDLARRIGTRSGVTVADLMTRDVVSATPATTLRQASNLMRGRTIGCLLVVDAEDLVGIVTTTDLLDQLGRGATRPTVRTEPAPVRRPPGSGNVGGSRNIRRATGPRRGRRTPSRAAERSALPSSLPRPLKVTQDRTSLPLAHIRVLGGEISEHDREAISRKLGRRLGKFASSIERITLRLSDANGPKGGRDQVCQIKVVLSGLPSIVVEERASAFGRAVDAAISSVGVAVKRSVERRRMKPLKAQPRAKAAQL